MSNHYLDGQNIELHRGDWIKFYHDSRLVIAEIEYIVPKWNGTYYVTQYTEISYEQVIDYRRKK